MLKIQKISKPYHQVRFNSNLPAVKEPSEVTNQYSRKDGKLNSNKRTLQRISRFLFKLKKTTIEFPKLEDQEDNLETIERNNSKYTLHLKTLKDKQKQKVGGYLTKFFFDKEAYHSDIWYQGHDGFRKTEEVHGNIWTLPLLRSFDTIALQKLWFALLTERNRLYTMRYEYARNNQKMPSIFRLDKVAESMSNLRTVLEEREQAKNVLKTGHANSHPGQYVYDFRGTPKWQRYKEHAIPKSSQPDHLQEYAYSYKHPDTVIDTSVVREWQLRQEEQKFMETFQYKKFLKRKWHSYVVANPEDNLPEKAPKWWLNLPENQPKYNHDIWVNNLPLRDLNREFRNKISQNIPGNVNP